MAESSIPVDLLNPGHVFACLGVLEAAELLIGDAMAAFDWDGGRGPRFRVAASGEEPPVERVLRFLGGAEIVARAPAGSPSLGGNKWKSKWGKTEFAPAGKPFPFRDPGSPAMLPAVLVEPGGREIVVDHWGDTTRRRKVKFWAGSRGYPGAAIIRDAVEAVGPEMERHGQDPFALARPLSNGLRFDWRRDNVPIQDGFSVNKNRRAIRMVGFPLVEVLAAIGVTHARPRRRLDTKLEYRYGVIGQDDRRLLLEPVFHRVALGASSTPVPGLPFRRFVMRLDWPAKSGQMRSITQVHEENTAG